MTIASITTLPTRRSRFIYDCIEGVAHQTKPFDRIIVWFQGDESQCWFKDVEEMYDNVEIRYVSDKAKSKSKFCYTMCEFPEHNILMVDDDLCLVENYHETMLAGLEKHPDCIITSSFAMPILDCKISNVLMTIMPNETKHMEYKNLWIKPMSGWGTLIPAHLFDKSEILDIDKGNSLFPTSDEWWIYCNAVTNGIKTYCVGRYTCQEDYTKTTYQYDSCLYNSNRNLLVENGSTAYKYLLEHGIDINKLDYEDLDNEV